jgi:uncharacterized protein (DUF2236 family)
VRIRVSLRGQDFTRPAREPALVPADSVSWQIFKNPLALFVGGVAAVILELADPAVRTGVWEHTDFRRDPRNGWSAPARGDGHRLRRAQRRREMIARRGRAA